MREQRLECPRCRGEMRPGYVLDHGNHDARRVSTWVEGVPEKSFWLGLKTEDRAVLPVLTYRCARCGYLESYAKTNEA